MEVDGRQWNPIEVEGHILKQMEAEGSNGSRGKQMEAYEKQIEAD